MAAIDNFPLDKSRQPYPDRFYVFLREEYYRAIRGSKTESRACRVARMRMRFCSRLCLSRQEYVSFVTERGRGRGKSDPFPFFSVCSTVFTLPVFSFRTSSFSLVRVAPHSLTLLIRRRHFAARAFSPLSLLALLPPPPLAGRGRGGGSNRPGEEISCLLKPPVALDL